MIKPAVPGAVLTYRQSVLHIGSTSFLILFNWQTGRGITLCREFILNKILLAHRKRLLSVDCVFCSCVVCIIAHLS